MGTTSTPASPARGWPRKLHEMLTGRSPLDTWQLSCTLSPMFTSSSSPNGRMCGSTGETGRLSPCVLSAGPRALDRDQRRLPRPEKATASKLTMETYSSRPSSRVQCACVSVKVDSREGKGEERGVAQTERSGTANSNGSPHAPTARPACCGLLSDGGKDAVGLAHRSRGPAPSAP